MWLSRITIKNFRNFKLLDVKLGEHAVVLGENKVGKTNLLFALPVQSRSCSPST
jgi:putative ATP-dependent endonuclease of OLD family